MKYLRGRLITAKYVTCYCGTWSLFETYCQFETFDLIKNIFTKIQLAFKLFLQSRDSYEVCN